MVARRHPQHRSEPHEPDGQYGKFPSYKGGPTTTYGGYVWEFVGDHPLANRWGFAAQHRLVGMDLVGRPLRKGEVVHHHNERRWDNRPENLEVMQAKAHRAHHASLRSERNRLQLAVSDVQAALAEHGAVKPAARALGLSHSSLRLRFPDLCKPYRRKTPAKVHEAPHLDQIRKLSADPHVGLREAAAATGMSIRTFCRIAERNGVEWVKQERRDKGRPRAGGWRPGFANTLLPKP